MSDMVNPPSKRARAGPDLKIILDDGDLEVHGIVLYLASVGFANMLDILSWNQGLAKSLRPPGKARAEFQTFYKALQFNCGSNPPGPHFTCI